MEMIVEKIVLEQFMGVDRAEYDFASKKLIDIKGRNGSGKSTIPTAHLFLWADRDYSLVANPEVHPMHLEESEPTVRETINIDGTRIEVCKVQKDGRTKKEKDAGKPFKVKNIYEINAVPMTQTNFMEAIRERGVKIDKFLLFSHPDFCVSQKSADFRKLLFCMSDSKSDDEIAATMPECAELSTLLKTYSTDEVAAIYKRQKSQGKEELDAIPQKILGMEQAKQAVDVDAAISRSDFLEGEYYAKMAKYEDLIVPNRVGIEEQIRSLKDADERSVREFSAKAKQKYDEATLALRSANFEEREASARLSNLEEKIKSAKEDLDSRLKKYEALKKETFPKSSIVCPTCGQKLPTEKSAEIMSNWTLSHEKAIAEMKDNGNTLAKSIKALEADLAKAKKEFGEKTAEYKKAEVKAAKAEEAYKKSLVSAPQSVNDEKIAELRAQLDSIDSILADKRSMKAEMDSIKAELRDCERELAKDGFNRDIDKQIEEMRVKQKEVAQAVADAEKILYQLSLLSQKKNELLEESVNKNFPEFVRFKLFEYLKNGDVKDACTPMILDDGEWKDYNCSANNGLKVLAKIGILRGIQNHFNAHYPIFLDNAECLDSETKKRVADGVESQMIFLSVSEDNKLTFC